MRERLFYRSSHSALSIIIVLVMMILMKMPDYVEAQRSLEFYDLLPEDPKLYDKMRPPKKDNSPTIVYFHVTVMGLDSIDENSMTYAADIFFAQTWKDNRLRLPENMTSEYRLLEVDWLKRMWRPDSFFKNAKSVTFQTMTIPNHYLWLYKDKTILYMVKLTLKLSCAMNFLIYPHDTQECKLQMESLSHTTDEMIFQWDPDVPLVVDENIELPQLQLIKNYTADCTQVYSTGNFTCLEVIFVLKRRLGYYLFHTYVPTCLIVIMSWVSFWIKPEAAPARVTLGVTSLLTLSTQHAKSQASLPPVSYLKAVDAFMSVCTIFVFMALMEYCLVNIILIMGESDPPKPSATPPPAPPTSGPGGGGTGGGGGGGPAEPNKLDKPIFDIASKVVPPRSISPPRPDPAISPPRPTYVLPIPPPAARGMTCYYGPGIPGPPQLIPATVIARGAQERRGRSSRSSASSMERCCGQDSAMLLSSSASTLNRTSSTQKPPAPPTNNPATTATPANPAAPAKPNKMQRAKIRAVNIDRTSRVLFPALFAFLNISYWIIFWKYV